jgi:MoaA/NifB/PqqE/SkfB family radical SAM enzyme
MYIKITNKCNMRCSHCGMSSHAKGKHMPMDTFKQAIRLTEEHGEESISIGGGEPTTHPEFWSILGQCIGSFDYVWMATNGKNTEIAIKLANMARKGILGVALSQDPYHEQIDPRVVRAFNINKFSRDADDAREIRDTSHHLSNVGRAKLNGLHAYDTCICEDNIILPSGKIKWCGCTSSPVIGDVWYGIGDEYREEYQDGELMGCYRER